MNFEIPTETRILQDLARKFAQREVAPVIDGFIERSEFPTAIVRRAAALGFLGVPYPEQYGGGGMGILANAVLLEEIARVDPSVAVIVMTNNSPSSVLNAFGTEEQKRKWLAPLLAGEFIGCVGITEPGGGSDVASAKTRAVRDGSDWVINGRKIFITNSGSELNGLVVVVANTGEKNGKPAQSLFVVPQDAPGFEISSKISTIGWRASVSCELSFDDVRVPAENLIGVEGEGLKQILISLSSGRIAIAAICLGLAQGAFDRAEAYAKERHAFGQPIIGYQGVSFKLVDMATRIRAGRWLVYESALKADNGENYRVEASMAKLFCSEMAFDAAREAIQIHGSYGVSVEYSVSKLLGDAKILEIVEGTSEIQRVLLAKLLGF